MFKSSPSLPLFFSACLPGLTFLLLLVLHPVAYGQTPPGRMGVDVSKYQGTIDWEQVKADGIEFCFIRATQGKKIQDPYFVANQNGAVGADIPVGAYHFFTTNRTGKAQARNLLKTVHPNTMDYPLVIDVERLDDMDPEKMREELIKMIAQLEKKRGLRPILYAAEFFYRDHLRDHFRTYPVWIARYREQPPDFQHWLFWQYSQTGSINGIKGHVDLNRMRTAPYRMYQPLPGFPKKLLRGKEPKIVDNFSERWNAEEINGYLVERGNNATVLVIDVLNPIELRDYATDDLKTEGLTMIHDLQPTLNSKRGVSGIEVRFLEVQGGLILRETIAKEL